MDCKENLVGLTQYDGQCSFFDNDAPLSEGVGWGVVLGLGLLFSLLTTLLVFVDYKFSQVELTSEQFNTAGRSIKTGLIASSLVSDQTNASTLLQSSNVAWQYGISGPFWYASSASFQMFLFSILAIQLKRKVPTAHTILEVVKYRWGSFSHVVLFVYCLLTNIIISISCILGGAAVIEVLTGMNIYAAAVMIPIGGIIYTVSGGLKATFITGYIHTAIIYVILCLFIFVVYTSDNGLGSISNMYSNLEMIASVKPVDNNLDGSYLTILSEGSLAFAIISMVGNAGIVVLDQSCWQSAIAARPLATYKGYLLGGLGWFCIPFSLATILGLASRALDLPLTSSEAQEGLVAPAVALHLLGSTGALLILIMLFMGVTPSTGAQIIAVASLFSYDMYKTYINPKANDNQILYVTRIGICLYGLFSGGLAIALLKIGVNLGWMYLFMGIVLGSAVVPIVFTLLWKDANSVGVIAGTLVGNGLAIVAWLSCAYVKYGEITIETTGENLPMLTGSLVAIISSGCICTLLSILFPQQYDWDNLKDIAVIEEAVPTSLDNSAENSPEVLSRGLRRTIVYGTVLTLITLVAWPVLAIPARVFSLGYFTFWVIMAFSFGVGATVIMIVLPLWESREGLAILIYRIITCDQENQQEKEYYDSEGLGSATKTEESDLEKSDKSERNSDC